MKKLTLLLIGIVFTSTLFAQNSNLERQKEIGLTFRSFDNFGITYRTGTERALWRFSTLALNVGNTADDGAGLGDRNSNNFGVVVGAGREFRKALAEQFELRYGVDVALNYQYLKSEYDNANGLQINERKTFGQNLNFIFGFNYLLTQNLVLGVELSPGLSHWKTNQTSEVGNNLTEVNTSGYGFSLSNGTSLLSMIYRF